MQRKSFEEVFSDINEASAEEFLKEDAKRLGIPWHVYCYTHGILGAAQKKRIRRHEEPKYEIGDMTPTNAGEDW